MAFARLYISKFSRGSIPPDPTNIQGTEIQSQETLIRNQETKIQSQEAMIKELQKQIQGEKCEIYQITNIQVTMLWSCKYMYIKYYTVTAGSMQIFLTTKFLHYIESKIY